MPSIFIRCVFNGYCRALAWVTLVLWFDAYYCVRSLSFPFLIATITTTTAATTTTTTTTTLQDLERVPQGVHAYV